jgi:hypothetical protein
MRNVETEAAQPAGDQPPAAAPPPAAPESPAASEPSAAAEPSAASKLSAAAGSAAVTEPEAGENLGARAERSPRDMTMSLAVLLIPIALIALFYKFVLSGDAPVTVDAGPTIEEAQAANVFPIAVPKLGDSWHASSATWQKTAAGSTLRIGYVDPDDNPVQLIESNIDSQTLARTELTTAAAQIDRYTTGAQTWALYTGRPGEQGLVRFDQGRTIIIVGRAKATQLESLASSLS